MKTRSHLAALCRAIVPLVLLLAFAAPQSQAQPNAFPPGQISYQGFLVDANGVALATNAPKNYDVIFRIYNTAANGTPVWGELQTVTVDRGYFSVLLGQGSSVPGAPFTNDLSNVFVGTDASDRYIGLTVKGLAGGDVEIQPRMRLLASPYSLLARTANNALKLNGYDWTTVFPDTGNPATGTIPGGKIAAGTLTASQLTNGAVGTAQLANNAVTAANIAPFTITSGQIASNTITGDQMSIPFNLTANYALSIFSALFGSPAIINVTNTAVPSGSGLGATFGGIGLKSGGTTAIEGFSQSGNSAYIADGSYAGEFYGNVTVHGTLSKSGGSFKIDHPLDPANKTLSHSFVESPDMKNIYDGVVTLSANGDATVTLPNWFGALNKDFRYQLTAIGAPGPNLYISQEVTSNYFKIAGGTANGKVSWQVTGIRQDAWANANRIPVEEWKPEAERGTYLTPEVFGQTPEKSVRTARHPEPKQQAK